MRLPSGRSSCSTAPSGVTAVGSTCPAREGAAADDGIVDGVAARGTHIPCGVGVRSGADLGRQVQDDIVQVCEQFVGRQVDIGQGRPAPRVGRRVRYKAWGFSPGLRGPAGAGGQAVESRTPSA